MDFFNSFKKTVGKFAETGMELAKYHYKKEKLFNEYENLTNKKPKVKEKSTGKIYYMWIEGEDVGDPFKFETLYILDMWDEILKKITPENINNIDLLYNFATQYSYDDIIYTNGVGHIIVTSSKTLEFSKVPNETSVTNNLSLHKNIFLDPIFRNEFLNWKNEFLPNKYISVKLDFYNTLNDMETAKHLKHVIDTKDYPVHWMYIKDNYLCIQNAINNLAELKGLGTYQPFDESNIQKYNIDDVECFVTYGDIEKSTVISGGEIKGGGTNITGALIGGALLGDVGAVIGSRNAIESTPITTTYKYDDNRIVRIILKEQFVDLLPEEAVIYCDGKKVKDTSTLEALSFLMPEKDYRLLAIKKQTFTEKEDDVFSKIEKLNELLQKGIITEEEFNKKKEELLNKI